MKDQCDTSFLRHLYYPSPQLQGIVDFYSILTPSAITPKSIPWHIMPDGAAHILFHVYVTGQKAGFPTYQSRLLFVGPRSVYLLTDRKRRVLSFIVRLKPGVSFFDLAYPLCDLKDDSINLESLISIDLTQDKEELTTLAVQGKIAELIRRFDELLSSVSGSTHRPHGLLNEALRCIYDNRGQTSVSDLAIHLGISERHLRSVFSKRVGLSPKRYARIHRLTKTIEAIDGGFAFGNAQLAINAGFYDQSHMIDEFQALVGESTNTFIARSNRENVIIRTSDFSYT